MAIVAAIYSVACHLHTPEAIMGLDAVDADPEVRPRSRNKRVWASVARQPGVVIDALFAEAQARDPRQRRPWALLGDGHEDQLKHIQAAIKRYGVSVILTLDLIHVLEYLWKVAYRFHDPGCEEAQARVRERALQVLKGHASARLPPGCAAVRRYRNCFGVSGRPWIPVRIICSSTNTC